MNDFALPLWVLEIHKKVWLVGWLWLLIHFSSMNMNNIH